MPPGEPASEAELIRAANALHDQALQQQQRGRPGRALVLCRHALGFVERVRGPASVDAANVGNTLAAIQEPFGELTTAERLFRRSVEITAVASTDPDTHIVYIQSVDGLAVGCGRRALARRSAAIGEAALGADHIEVAADLAARAAILDGQGKLEEAATLYRPSWPG